MQPPKKPNCGTSHGVRQWVNLEPCGLFCGLVTWWLLAYDPGAVPRDSMPLPDDEQENDYEAAPRPNGDRYRKFCKRCKAFKPLRAHHCSVCGRCIVKMDHHCPWVNNCVGVGNHKLFLLFLLWVNVVCGYALVLIICKYSFCKAEGCGTSSENLLAVFLLVEAALFGLFTVCMMGDQSSVLVNNQTKIDVMKGTKNDGVEGFNEVFGCSNDVTFKLNWLIPFKAEFPDNVRDRVMGFCVETSQYELGDEGMPLTSKSPAAATEGLSLEMTSLNYDAEDLARQRLGSSELWAISETSIGVVPESTMSMSHMMVGRGADNVRRRSGPPF